jgi:hypothetical protein
VNVCVCGVVACVWGVGVCWGVGVDVRVRVYSVCVGVVGYVCVSPSLCVLCVPPLPCLLTGTFFAFSYTDVRVACVPHSSDSLSESGSLLNSGQTCPDNNNKRGQVDTGNFKTGYGYTDCDGSPSVQRRNCNGLSCYCFKPGSG